MPLPKLRPPPPDDDLDQGGGVAVAPLPKLRPPPADDGPPVMPGPAPTDRPRGSALMDALGGVPDAQIPTSARTPVAYPKGAYNPPLEDPNSPGKILGAYAKAIPAAAGLAVVDTGRGLINAGDMLGRALGAHPNTDPTKLSLADVANLTSRTAHEDAARALAPAPGATKGAELVAGAAPFFTSLPVAAVATGGNAFADAKEGGATDSQAALSAALQGSVAGAFGPIGRVVAPAARAAGAVAGKALGGAVAPIVEAGASNAAQGLAQSGAAVAGRSTYDPEGAMEALKDAPAEALTFGALGAIHPAAAALRHKVFPGSPPVDFNPDSRTPAKATDPVNTLADTQELTPVRVDESADTARAPTPRWQDTALVAKLRQAGIPEAEIADLSKHQAGLALDEKALDDLRQDPTFRPERGDIPALLERMKAQGDADKTQTDLTPVRDDTLADTQTINPGDVRAEMQPPGEASTVLRPPIKLRPPPADDIDTRQDVGIKDRPDVLPHGQETGDTRTDVPVLPGRPQREAEAANRAAIEADPELSKLMPPAAVTPEHVQGLTQAIAALTDHLKGTVPRSTKKLESNTVPTTSGVTPKESPHGILEAQSHPQRPVPVPGRENEGQHREAGSEVQRTDQGREAAGGQVRAEADRAQRQPDLGKEGHDPDQEPIDRAAAGEAGDAVGRAANQDHAGAPGRAEAPVPGQSLARPRGYGVDQAAETRRVAPVVSRAHDVPLGGGISEDGRTVYVDPRMPKKLIMRDGKVADVDQATAVHERAEHQAMAAGKSYADAHEQDAVPAENAYLKSKGIDPAEYNRKLKPTLDRIAKSGKRDSLPPDLHPKHVEATNALPRSTAQPSVAASERATPPEGVAGKPAAAPVRGAEAPSKPAVEATAAREPSGVAPGDRKNSKPALAIPSEKEAVRDFMKAEDAKSPEREPTTREAQRAEGDARLAKDYQGEANRLRKKMQAKELVTESERHQVGRVIEDAYARGDLLEAAVMHNLLRANRGALASDLASGFDPSESPAQRGVRHIRENMLTPPQHLDARLQKALKDGNQEEANRINKKWSEQVDGLKRQIRKLGVDPDTLQPISRPLRNPAAQGIITRRRQKLAADMQSLRDEWKKLGSKRSVSANALGGERVDLLAKMLFNRAEAGLLRFADAVRAVGRQVPEAKKAPQDLEAAWEKLRAAHPEMKLDAAGSADEALNGTPEQKLARAVERAQKLADSWAAKHAEAKGMTSQERLDFLTDRANGRKVPADIADAVKGIRDEAKRLQKEILTRDRALMEAHDHILGKIAAAKSDKWDVAYEWFRSALHTSIKLLPIKAATDLTNLAYHTIINRGLGSALSGTANMRDVRAFGNALGPAFGRAADAFRRSIADERAAFDQDLGHGRAQTLFERGQKPEPGEVNEFHQAPLIQHKILKHIRWNIRTVVAMDQWAKAFTSHLEVAAHAHEGGVAKGLADEALAKHIESETDNLGSDSWQAAMKSAREVTGTTPHHGRWNPIAALQRLKTMDPHDSESRLEYAGKRFVKEAARYGFPFVALPFNFVAKGLRVSPVGTARLLYKLADSAQFAVRNGEWTYKTRDIGTDVAQQVIAWGALATMSSMVNGDSPTLTGYDQWDPKERDVPAPPPHSFHFAGEWRDYSKLGPVAHLIGTAADLLRAHHNVQHGQSLAGETDDKGKKQPGALQDFAGKLVDQVESETFLRGIKDLYEAHTLSGAEKLAVNIASGFYPIMFKQMGSATDQHAEERRVKEGDFAPRVGQMLRQRIEAPGFHDEPQVDLFGHDINKDSGATNATDWLARMVNPYKGQPDRQEDGDLKAMLVRWNNDHPTARVEPGEPQPRYTANGVSKEMDPKQYHDFLTESGRMSASIIRGMKFDKEKPTAQDMEQVRRAISTSQRMVKERIGAESRQAEIRQGLNP